MYHFNIHDMHCASKYCVHFVAVSYAFSAMTIISSWLHYASMGAFSTHWGHRLSFYYTFYTKSLVATCTVYYIMMHWVHSAPGYYPLDAIYIISLHTVCIVHQDIKYCVHFVSVSYAFSAMPIISNRLHYASMGAFCTGLLDIACIVYHVITHWGRCVSAYLLMDTISIISLHTVYIVHLFITR